MASSRHVRESAGEMGAHVQNRRDKIARLSQTQSVHAISKPRAPYETVPLFPSSVPLEAAREAMSRSLEERNPCGALFWAEMILQHAPDDLDARECALRSNVTLELQYVEWLGGWSATPMGIVLEENAPRLALDPEQIFVLQQMDGNSTLQDLVDVTPMAALDVLKLIFGLVHGGLAIMG
jgi:hypothetical protein